MMKIFCKINTPTPFLLLVMAFMLIPACGRNKSNEKGEQVHPSQKETAKSQSSTASADWEGVFRGILPCEDCEGIKTELELGKNMSYTKKERHSDQAGEILISKGEFTVDKAANTITLNSDGSGTTFMITENGLEATDKTGKVYSGNTSENHFLRNTREGVRLTDGRWNLIRLRGKEITPREGEREAYLIFDGVESRVSGNNSCNQISGGYTLKAGNRIEFTQLIMTQMACMPNEIEGPFMEVLGVADNYTINGDTLSLNKARMAPLAQFVLDFMQP